MTPKIELKLRIEHRCDAFGIGVDQPRLSWLVETDLENWKQAGYGIKAYTIDGQLLQQTGRVESDQSVLVDWPFESLRSRERVRLQVWAWRMDGSESNWSELCHIETGLLQPEDWNAQLISPDWEEDKSKPNPDPYLRREFVLRQGIQSARASLPHDAGIVQANRAGGLPQGRDQHGQRCERSSELHT